MPRRAVCGDGATILRALRRGWAVGPPHPDEALLNGHASVIPGVLRRPGPRAVSGEVSESTAAQTPQRHAAGGDLVPRGEAVKALVTQRVRDASSCWWPGYSRGRVPLVLRVPRQHLSPAVGVGAGDASAPSGRHLLAQPEVGGDALTADTAPAVHPPSQPEVHWDALPAGLLRLSITLAVPGSACPPSSLTALVASWPSGGVLLRGLRRQLFDGSGGGLGAGTAPSWLTTLCRRAPADGIEVG